MDAPIIISIVALVISGASLYLVIQRERRDRIRFNDEQVGVAQQREAGLSAAYRAGPRPTDDGYEYRYRLVNTSDFYVRVATGWLVDEQGTEVSERAPGTPDNLQPNESGELRVVAHSIERPLTLHLRWFDPRGPGQGEYREKTSTADVPPRPGGGIGRGRGGPVVS
jgi:type II secretory pathway pseudopilin PulG